MSRDDIIRMAGEAGFPDCKPENHPFVASSDLRAAHEEFLANLHRFAALVAAHERVQCAKVCEDLSLSRNTDWEAGTLDCAAAIRARRQT